MNSIKYIKMSYNSINFNLDIKKINFYKGDCENLEFMTKVTNLIT